MLALKASYNQLQIHLSLCLRKLFFPTKASIYLYASACLEAINNLYEIDKSKEAYLN